jgi:two-component system cell cycle sensor histidine kinase/response regulator CckA
VGTWQASAVVGALLFFAAALVVISLRRAWRRSEALRSELQLANIELVEANAQAHHARESAEAAVHRKEEVLAILDTVLDSSPVAFALYDLDLRLIRINRAFAELTGHAPLDHIGETLGDLSPALANALVPSLDLVLTEDAGLRDVEITLDGTPDDRGIRGARRHWLASFYPVRTASGGMLGVGALMLEVSERKNLEEQFRQAQKMEAVGRLAGGIAHDFNNLLTVMSSCSELLLLDLAKDDRRRTDVEEIRRAAQRAAGLTRQLLAFSRKQILQPTMLDLNAIVAEMEKMLRRVLGEDVALATVLDPDLGFVRADHGQVEQVLMNLVVNARDAMPRGGKIILRTRNIAQPDGDPLVALEVIDEGVGIASDALPHIFEPFYTTKEQGKGTGLGLSTVYGIVKQSGGDVEVDTTLGRGTTFRILLPRYREAPSTERASPTGIIAPRSRATILLVEDEDAVRALAMRILRREGYTVYVASNAVEAETVFASNGNEIALLVSDLVLPGVGGMDLARRLRDRRPSLTVLLMSGYSDRDVGAFQSETDRVAFLQKPFTPDSLVGRVGELLGGAMTVSEKR